MATSIPETTTTISSSTVLSKSKAQYIIRPASLEDAEAIATLLPHVWVHTFSAYLSAGGIAQHVMPMFTVERIRAYLSSEDQRWFVAVPDPSFQAFEDRNHVERDSGYPTVLGTAQIKLDVPLPSSSPLKPTGALESVRPEDSNNPAYLARLFVHPSQHGSGLARNLLLSTEVAAREMGHDAIWLVVLQQNARGIRFYEKLGYVKIGEKERKEEWFEHVGDIMLRRLISDY